MQRFPFFRDINEQFSCYKLRRMSQYYLFKNNFQAQPQVTFCINIRTFIHSFQPRSIMQTPHRSFFFYLGFLSRTFTARRTAEGEGGYLLTPLYHFHPLHRRLEVKRVITVESSPLHIASSQTLTGNLSFPNTSH